MGNLLKGWLGTPTRGELRRYAANDAAVLARARMNVSVFERQMSQWGTTREFREGDCTLKIQAHVAGPVFEPISDRHIVDSLLITDCKPGNTPQHGDRLFATIQKLYVGKPYAEWCKPGTASERAVRKAIAFLPAGAVEDIMFDLVIDLAVRVNEDPIEMLDVALREWREKQKAKP